MFQVKRIDLQQADPYFKFTYAALEEQLKKERVQHPQPPVMMVGASKHGKPCGMVLAICDEKNRQAKLITISVRKQDRNQGIGTALMNQLERECRKAQWERMHVKYYTIASHAAFQRLLQKSGWETWRVYSTYYKINVENIRASSFWTQRRFPLPPSYQVCQWADIDREEWQRVNDLEETAYRPYFSPLRDEESIVPSCSFAVKHRGKIVAWSIIDRDATNIVRYRSLYVREDYRQRGLGIRLGMEAARRVSDSPFDQIVIEILQSNRDMHKIGRKLLDSLFAEIQESRISGKELP